MAESFCCPSETITTLLIDYTPNEKFNGKGFVVCFRGQTANSPAAVCVHLKEAVKKTSKTPNSGTQATVTTLKGDN